MLRIFALMIVVAFSIPSAQAAQKADVEQLTRLIKARSEGKSAIYYTSSRETDEAKFELDGKRYRLIYDKGDVEGRKIIHGSTSRRQEPLLAIEVRPIIRTLPFEDEGGYGIADKHLNGSVDLAILDLRPIAKVGEDPERKKFVSNSEYCSAPTWPEMCGPVGLEFQQYWQTRYDEEIQKLLDFYLKRMR